MENNYTMTQWRKSAIKIGTPTNLLAVLTCLVPAIYLCVTYDCWPDTKLMMTAWGLAITSYGLFYIIEPVTFYPSLGLSGTYMAFLSGNAGNMRLPCSTMALDVTNSKIGTLQAEVVSTMAIAGSVITNLIATTSAALIGTVIVSILPQFIVSGLQTYATAAIFGGLLGTYALKQPKVVVAGLCIAFIFKVIIPVPVVAFVLISVFGTAIVARILYVADQKKAEK